MSNFKLFAVFVVCLVSLVLSSCKNDKEESVSDFCKKYVSSYEVVQNNEDGSSVISVTAPDFESIAKKIAENEQNEELNVKALENAIKDNPEEQKNYVFTVGEMKTEEIENAFLQQVSYELMTAAIKQVDYVEDWSVQE